MEKDVFLLLGGNRLNFGIYQKFKNLGFYVVVVDWNKNPFVMGDLHLQIDVKDHKAIVCKLTEINLFKKVRFAYSSIDLAVESVAIINRLIGLNSINKNGLINSTSKSRMTEKWSNANLLNRKSWKFEKFDESIIEINRKMKIIIKPDNSASSRGITILQISSQKIEIIAAFAKALEESSDGLVVVEEFVEGQEFTVEMIGDLYGNVCVYAISEKSHTQYVNNNKIATKLHYNISRLDIQQRIAEFAIQCYKALQFSCSLGHLEVILKPNGELSPIEIGARSSGYIASTLVDVVAGTDYLQDLIKVQKGMPIQNGLHPQTQMSSVYYFYDFPPNSKVIKECSIVDFLESSVTSLYCNRENIIKSHSFCQISNDNQRYGYEILVGNKEILTKEYLRNQEKYFLAECLDIVR